MRICAVIPARGGSKGIPLKNITKINNLPLIYFSINAALKSKLIEDVFLATDSLKIANIAKKISKKLKVINRLKKNASDTATTESFIFEFLDKYSYDIIVLIQPTNIFIDTKNLNQGIKKIINSECDSLLSVVESHKFMWTYKNNNFKPINYTVNKRPRRQDSNKYFIENGSFYIFKSINFVKYSNRLHKKIGFVIMKQESLFDIDEFEDLKIVKKLIRK